MTKFFLSLHVLAAVIAIGPVAVAASMFPAVARKAVAESAGDGDRAGLRLLHRITRVYAYASVAVPLFGFVTAGVMNVTGQLWVMVSIALTVLAAAVLLVLVLPNQEELLVLVDGAGSGAAGAGESFGVGRMAGRLAMYAGIFNLLWAVVTVIMILRPGSTAG